MTTAIETDFLEKLSGSAGLSVEDQLRLAQSVLGQMRESVVITGNDLEAPGPVIIYVNEAFTRMTGWRAEEVVGRANPRILQGPNTTRKTMDRLRARLEKGEVFEGEDINYRKDGSEFYIDWYIEALRDEAGAIRYWVAIQKDITERRALEAQLLQAQRLEGIGMLASGISHDLNNVLAPVMMGCDYLRGKVTDPQAVQFIALLEEAAERGAGLVRQILSFGRGLTGGGAVVEPRHIISEITRMAKATFSKTVRVVADTPIGGWNVETDATQLHQILLNLCVNARDAVGDSGTITLAASNVEITTPRSTMRGELAPGRYVMLAVIDTGSGMPPEVLRAIFDPFFSTKAPGKGTGLGLATLAMIVKNQRGGIEIRTAPGEGTTFQIYLPAAVATARVEDAVPPLTQSGRGRSILVADDEAAISAILRETLQSAGYCVTTASDGMAALAIALEAKPDLAVIDLLMPAVGGALVIQELRARQPGLPVIVISGLSRDESMQRAPSATAYLQKPFTLAELLAATDEALSTA